MNKYLQKIAEKCEDLKEVKKDLKDLKDHEKTEGKQLDRIEKKASGENIYLQKIAKTIKITNV